MKLKLILKILPIELVLVSELKTNQNFIKGLFFQFLSTISGCSLKKPNLILKNATTSNYLGFVVNKKTKCE